MTVHLDFQSAEGGRAEDVLQRFVIGPAPDQLPHRLEIRLTELPPEIEVQLQPRLPQHMRQQQFGLQTRRVHAFAAEEFRAALNDIQNGHGRRLVSKFEVQSSKLFPLARRG